MKNSFIGDLFSVMSSRGAVIVLNLAANIVTARYLGPEGNGTIAGLMVYPSMFMTIGSLGIRQATTYFTGSNKYDVGTIYSSVLAIWTFTSIFSLVSSFFLIRYFAGGSYSVILILLAIAPIPFSLFNTYSSGIFLGKQNIKEFNRINWVPALFNLVFTFLLVAILPLGVEGSMAGTFFGIFFFFLFVYKRVQIFANIKIQYDFKVIKEMLGIGLIYAVSLLMTALNYKVDIILMEKLSTAEELGIYSKGAALIENLWIIPTLLSTIVFSRSAAAKDPQQFSIKVCRLLRLTGGVIFVACIILYFLSDLIIKILFGEAFLRSASVLEILIPGVLLLTIFKVLNMDLAGKGKPWLSMKAMAPAVLINVGLNLYLIPKFGADGSALSSTISYSLAAIFYLLIYSKETSIPVWQILKYTKEDFDIVQSVLSKMKNKRVHTKQPVSDVN